MKIEKRVEEKYKKNEKEIDEDNRRGSESQKKKIVYQKS